MILTDSISSVFALSFSHTSSHHLVPKIASLLSGLPLNKVTVQLVVIPSSELADNVAKRSLHLSYTTQVPLSADDISFRLESLSAALWQLNWDFASSHFPVSISNVQSLPTYFSLPHREQIAVVRLYLRKCLLTHVHFFLQKLLLLSAHLATSLGVCPTYLLPALLWSILAIACVHSVYPHMLPFNINSILHANFPTEALINFLLKTTLISSI